MIVIPMNNHQEEIVGILQLINATDNETSRLTVFSKESEEKASALASQAAVLLTQQLLITEMRQLFEAFVKAIAVSIDEKSKHTGGHIQRVTDLSLLIAEKINQDSACFEGICLTPDEMEELRIAALMHDTGKITTPEHLIGKSSRLETVFDRIELIRTRFELFKMNQKLKTAERKLEIISEKASPEKIAKLDKACSREVQRLEDDLKMIEQINSEKAPLTAEKIKTLGRIHSEESHIEGKATPHLSKDEFENLSVQKGTVTRSERKQIKLHAHLTEKILNQLPWPKNLENIPFIAGAHHEKLDGTGYPLGLDKKHLNLQARILAIADIFEALSAPDRPYKRPMPLDKVEKVLLDMGEKGALDWDIIQVLFQSEVHLEYARKHLSPS